MKYLNFQEISKSIPFTALLNALAIPYTQDNGTLKGDGFIIDTAKNLYLNPNSKDKLDRGSVINFLSIRKNIPLREAAEYLYENFMNKQEQQKQIPELKLEYTDELKRLGISEELAKDYEIGYVKKGIMRGRVSFKVYNYQKESVGYVGYSGGAKQKWYIPKGFEKQVYNLHNCRSTRFILLTHDMFDWVHLIKEGFDKSCCLMGTSMTEKQELALKTFDFILLFHPHPENIVQRLQDDCFIKVPKVSLRDLTYSEIEALYPVKADS